MRNIKNIYVQLVKACYNTSTAQNYAATTAKHIMQNATLAQQLTAAAHSNKNVTNFNYNNNTLYAITLMHFYNKSVQTDSIIFRLAENLIVVNVNTKNSVTKKITAMLQTKKYANYIMQICKNNNINVQLQKCCNVDANAVYFIV